jgi:hypothetical protein
MLALAALLGTGAILAGPASGAAHAADLFTELRNFPGVVLVPPADLAPFKALEPWRLELNRPRAGAPATPGTLRGRYLVQYRDPQGGPGSAQVGGTLGRDEFDQTVTTLAMRSFARCPADAPYCVENVAGQDDAEPASELFRGLLVGDQEAVVEHVVCCGGHYWALSWYDAPHDMTYTLVLVGPVADAYSTAIAPDNAEHAAAIVEIAAKMTPLD